MSPTRSAHVGARALLSELRKLMAQGDPSAERLGEVVRLVATSMVADVCSIYLRVDDGVMALIATEGLKPEAVGKTRLLPGEGLVGLIAEAARPINLSNAPSHPRFSYRPETGEDPYRGFLGAPILRGGRVLGVLVVQNLTERRYEEDEIEAMQTIAMVVAEMLAASGDGAGEAKIATPKRLVGRTLNDGCVIGTVRLHDPFVPAARFFAADAAEERQRLEDALADLRRSIDTMLSGAASALRDDSRDVLEVFGQLAHDPGWERRLKEALDAGLSAEAAVDKVRSEHRARLGSARDPYLRERLHDLEDLENRLLRLLSAQRDTAGGAQSEPQAAGDILAASRIGPAELLEYADSGLKALVLEEGGAGSHAAIVARALGLPTISDLPGLMSAVEPGDRLIVDGETAEVHIRPPDSALESFAAKVELSAQRAAELSALRDLPAVTRDGVRVTLLMNAGLDFEMDYLSACGAEGVGLFRTEFQFLIASRVPRLDDQTEFYRGVLEKAGDKPVVFRTLDLGGDKIVPYLSFEKEPNPALGWRSTRLVLDRPGLLRRQLRALVRAAAERDLYVMAPFITEPSEAAATRELLDAELEWSRARGYPPPASVRFGAMIETPAIAYAIDGLARHVDFVSIGTNDLMQHFFAADRDNPKVSDRYSLLNPAALRFMGDLHAACARSGLEPTVCGEAAGRPREALALIALGYRRFSTSAGASARLKSVIRSADASRLKDELKKSLKGEKACFVENFP